MANAGSTRAEATPVSASNTGVAGHPPERAPSKPAKAEQPWWRSLGPGLITGAADDDPSGIATYSQGGAQFGYDVASTVLLTYPLMVAIQLASAGSDE
jgi:hypothetical protein